MRLTLRTLLAYVDEILEPDDAAEIAKKIEESEVATRLLQRIHDVARRLRLGAPDVLEPKDALDPNTVAEYLDYTLAADRVTDFEKVCLESDVQLAEVAACHQVLALVLGSPAEVAPATRERMYRIPEMAQQQEDPVREMFRGSSSDGEPEETSSRAGRGGGEKNSQAAQPRRPTFLRRAFLALVVLALVALGGVGVAWYAGWIDLPLAKTPAELARGLENEPPESDGAAQAASAVASQNGEAEEDTAGSETESDAEPAAPAAGNPGSDREGEDGGSAPDEGASAPDSDSQTEPEAPGAADQSQPAPPEVPEVDAPPGEPNAVAMEAEEPENGDFQPVEPAEAVASGVPRLTMPPLLELPTPLDTEPALTGTAEISDGAAGDREESVVAPLPPQSLGTLLTPEHVLLRVDATRRTVERLSAEMPIHSYDVLIALPEYRPEIQAGETLRMQVAGPAHFQVLPLDQDNAHGVSINFGRFVLRNTGETPSAIRLLLGSHRGTLALEPGNTAAVVEWEPKLEDGTDPSTPVDRGYGRIVVLQGEARWNSAEVAEGLLTPLKELNVAPQQESIIPLEDPVEWVMPKTSLAALLQERAAIQLQQLLSDSSRSILLGLREAAFHRQREVAWLAQRSLASLGDVELVAAALDDSQRKAQWPEAIAELRSAAARSPEMAAAVQASCMRVYGEDGPLVYEMLWRFPASGIPVDEAMVLVDALEHPRLAVRVLAIWNLQQITGVRMYYEPDSPAVRRRSSVERWRSRVESDVTLPGIMRGEHAPPAP